MSQSIQTDVIKLIHLETGTEIKKIQPESDLINDLGMDSMDVSGLIGSIENHFHIKITANDAATLNTVQELIQFIEKQQQ